MVSNINNLNRKGVYKNNEQYNFERMGYIARYYLSDAKDYYSRLNRATKVLTKEPDPEVGPSPKEVIWTKNKAKLYRYTSEHPKKHRVHFFLFMHLLINHISWI